MKKLTALVALCTVALSLTGCLPKRPPPIVRGESTTQPAGTVGAAGLAVARDWSTYRNGYLDALTVGTVARGVGKLSDKQANDLEGWRQLYLATIVGPKARLAEPFIDEGDWKRLAAEQESVENSWKALLPNPYQRPK